MSSVIEFLEKLKMNNKNKILIEDVIELIKETNKLIFIEDANSIIKEFEELKSDLEDNGTLLNIIDTQIRIIKDKLPSLKLKEDPIVIRVKKLDKERPPCHNPQCNKHLELKLGGSEYFWACPSYPKCWGKKKLSKIEFDYIYKGKKITEVEPKPKLDINFNEDLYKKLKSWRLIKSRECKYPAYIICKDITLIELASYFPSNKYELSKINGIGEKFLSEYCNEILHIIEEYKKDKEIITNDFCKDCGIKIRPTDNFCFNCGNSLKTS